MKNIIVKFGFQLRKNNNTRDMRVVILIITLIYVMFVNKDKLVDYGLAKINSNEEINFMSVRKINYKLESRYLLL